MNSLVMTVALNNGQNRKYCLTPVTFLLTICMTIRTLYKLY